MVNTFKMPFNVNS